MSPMPIGASIAMMLSLIVALTLTPYLGSIFICEEENLPAGHAGAEAFFYSNGIVISSFGYPDPSSKKISRIVINALHTKKDFKNLCNITESKLM